TSCYRDWSSDLCSSDLAAQRLRGPCLRHGGERFRHPPPARGGDRHYTPRSRARRESAAGARERQAVLARAVRRTDPARLAGPTEIGRASCRARYEWTSV